MTALVSKGNSTAPFVDTYRVLHPDETVVGTFTGFKMGNTEGDKIDYVLVQPGAEVISERSSARVGTSVTPRITFQLRRRSGCP